MQSICNVILGERPSGRPQGGYVRPGKYSRAVHSLLCSRYSPGQLPLPTMREGAVLDRLTAGQCIGRKVLRAQIGADLAVVTNL